MLALAVLGIAVSLSAPAMSRFLHQSRMRSALNQLSADVFHARMLAVHSARRVELRFVRPADDPCVEEYSILVMDTPPTQARRVVLQQSAPGLCLRKNGPNPMAFNSRGRPNWNYSFWIREGQMVDSLTITQLGRIYRW